MHEGTITITCENGDVKVRGLKLDEEDALHDQIAEHAILGSHVWTVLDPPIGPVLFSVRIVEKSKKEEVGVIL